MMQEEGLREFQQYLCRMVSERAQEGYNTLVEAGAQTNNIKLCPILESTHFD